MKETTVTDYEYILIHKLLSELKIFSSFKIITTYSFEQILLPIINH